MRFNLKLAAYVVLGCVAVATVAPFAAAKPAATAPPAAPATTAAPSWNDTAPKHAIVAFVDSVTKQGSPGFVPPPSASRCSTTMGRCGPSGRSTSSSSSRSIG